MRQPQKTMANVWAQAAPPEQTEEFSLTQMSGEQASLTRRLLAAVEGRMTFDKRLPPATVARLVRAEEYLIRRYGREM